MKPHRFRYEGETGIAESKAFQRKQLSDFACNIGNICEFGCAFCYVPAVTTKQKYVQEVLQKGYNWEDISLYRTKANLLECVEQDLRKFKRGDGDNRVVFFCTTCDPCATEEHAEMTIEAIRLIMEASDLQVRVLSKSRLILKIATELDPYRDRIIYGLSIGTMRPEVSACIEEHATPVSERIETLQLLRGASFRTFGMLCPILPSEMDHLDPLVDLIHPQECEQIWAEAINLRGKSLIKTRDKLRECGLEKDADVLETVIGDRSHWREYSKALFLALRKSLERSGCTDKLRFLQYVKQEPEDFQRFFLAQPEVCICDMDAIDQKGREVSAMDFQDPGEFQESEEVYFTCPGCRAQYDFGEFHELEHKSKASPSEPDVLGQAQCRHCGTEFYYYLTSDAYPILVDNRPTFDVLHAVQRATEAATSPASEPEVPVLAKTDIKDAGVAQEPQVDGMAQFEKALKNIDRSLSPPQLYSAIANALEFLVNEPQYQVEAAFALLKRDFDMRARDIEAFRKEMNRKREQAETEKLTQEIEAVISQITQPPRQLTDEEYKEALDYLTDPNLFENVSRDIAIAGELVGEEANKMMLYLAATSRKFKKPMSLVIFGKSSSGKSFLANTIEKFMPKEDTLVLSSLSARALEYAAEQLQHKLVLVQEWEGLKEVLPTLRTLQSEGKLSRFVTIIDPISKKRRAVSHELECPCSVIVTTTKEGIHDENSTRIFELYADESLDQTVNVVTQNLRRANLAERLADEEKSRILDLHHNVQRVLEMVYVNIPFAGHLSFPAKTTRHRRDSDRFINLIKAVAFLRQMQKEKKEITGIECIDADLEDYRIAYEIGMEVIKATLNPVSDRAKNAFAVCCELHEDYMDQGKLPRFSVSEIQEKAQEMGFDFRNRPDLYKQLDFLEEYEYLEKQQAKKGASRYYTVCFEYERDDSGGIINIDAPEIRDILTPEELEEKLKAEQAAAERV